MIHVATKTRYRICAWCRATIEPPFGNQRKFCSRTCFKQHYRFIRGEGGPSLKIPLYLDCELCGSEFCMRGTQGQFSARADYSDDILCSNCRRTVRHRFDTTGWTSSDYLKAFRQQNGKCFLCGVSGDQKSFVKGASGQLVADHDHDTGRRRKLLCGLCNGALGAFKDDPELMRTAADYIEAHREIS